MTRPRAVVSAVTATLVWYAATASAQSKAECLSAFDRAQDERSRLMLRAARDDFMFCARAGCSPPVRKDCSERLEEVLRDLPTVVLGARLSNGSDVSDAAILVDGERTSPDAGGLVALDPGPHTIRFERPPYAAQEQSIVVRIGEKSRLVLATFTETTPRAESPSGPPVREERRSPSVWVWAFAGTSVVALGSFTAFALMGIQKRSQLESTCAPGCSDDQIGELRSRFIAADVSLGVGLVSLTAAALVFLFDKQGKAPGPPSAGPQAHRFARSF